VNIFFLLQNESRELAEEKVFFQKTTRVPRRPRIKKKPRVTSRNQKTPKMPSRKCSSKKRSKKNKRRSRSRERIVVACQPPEVAAACLPPNDGDSIVSVRLPTDPYAQLVGFPAGLVADLTLLASPFTPVLGSFTEFPFGSINPVSPYPQITVVNDSYGNPAAFQVNTVGVFQVAWMLPVTAVIGTIALYQEVPLPGGGGLGPAQEIGYTATSAIVAVAGLTYFQNDVLVRVTVPGTVLSLRNTGLVALVLPTLTTLDLAPVPNFNISMISRI
jgi:hypothetical protein